jgi:DNA-binding transcriptional LysR family regulator
MTLGQLQIFVRVAQLQNVSLAAKQLQISQSAVSHALKNLEQNWQIKLFSREGQQMLLTPIGQTLLQHAKVMLATEQTMQQEVAALHGLQRGQLRIGSFGASASIHLLPELIQAYRQKYPNIEIFVDEGTDHQVTEWILHQQVDIGFAVLPNLQLDTYPLLRDIFIALVPKSYAIAQQPRIAIEQIQDYPFIMTHAGSQTHVEKLLKKHQVSPKIQYQVSQLLTILNMVNQQEGIAIVADMAMSNALLKLHPDLVKRPLWPNTERQIGLAVKNQRLMSPATRAFIALAQQLYHTK